MSLIFERDKTYASLTISSFAALALSSGFSWFCFLLPLLATHNQNVLEICDEQAIIAHRDGSLGQRKLASLLLNSHDDELWMVIWLW
jgi:hypothetical protein